MTVKEYLNKNKKSYLRYVVESKGNEEHLFTIDDVLKKYGNREIVNVVSARNLYIDL